jgi:FtsZ-binding cell division protein ZapB
VAYAYERPDLRTLDELDRLVGAVTEELAGWRRRAQKAETELAELKGHAGPVAGPELTQARQRIVDLETENQDLRRRVESARERVQALVSRLGFLERGVEAAS